MESSWAPIAPRSPGFIYPYYHQPIRSSKQAPLPCLAFSSPIGLSSRFYQPIQYSKQPPLPSPPLLALLASPLSSSSPLLSSSQSKEEVPEAVDFPMVSTALLGRLERGVEGMKSLNNPFVVVNDGPHLTIDLGKEKGQFTLTVDYNHQQVGEGGFIVTQY